MIAMSKTRDVDGAQQPCGTRLSSKTVITGTETASSPIIDYVTGVSSIEDDSQNGLRKNCESVVCSCSGERRDVVFFHSPPQQDHFTTIVSTLVCEPLLQCAVIYPVGGDLFDDRSCGPLIDPVTRMTNGSYILHGEISHLPFAKPRLWNATLPLSPVEERKEQSEYAAAMMGDMDSDMMER